MKAQRQRKILDIIEKYDIDTQEALQDKLREEGFEVTQTTISRDITQLKLVKAITSAGKYKYIVPNVRTENNIAVMSSALTDAVVKIVAAKNIVVIKTLSGMANAIAVCVDTMLHDNIVGSVAGDDTVLIVTADDDIAASMVDDLKAAFKLDK
jgi:transcriptional regulator of arginine metabolism